MSPVTNGGRGFSGKAVRNPATGLVVQTAWGDSGLMNLRDYSPWLADHWFDVKLFIERSINFSNDALHIFAGIAIQLAVAAISRRGVGSIWPWLAVLAFELFNEWADLSNENFPNPFMQFGEGMKDILLTMAVPTLLLIVARRWPRILR